MNKIEFIGIEIREENDFRFKYLQNFMIGNAHVDYHEFSIPIHKTVLEKYLKLEKEQRVIETESFIKSRQIQNQIDKLTDYENVSKQIKTKTKTKD
jgi:hypothetical protein